MSLQVITNDAPAVWNLLRGIFCVYKPPGLSVFSVRKTITHNITADLNEMKCREPGVHVKIEGEDTTKKLSVKVQQDYADDPLVVGPRYQGCDLRCAWATPLGYNTSGVMMMGVRDGTRLVNRLHNAHPIRTYRLKGELGYATDTYYKDGKITGKSKYEKVSQVMMDRWCASMQASHQSKMFEMSGVDIQSQAAYELAVQGLIRPANKDIPLIYGIKCVEFKPPEFTLEIQCINEYEMYLLTLIHELGYKLHTDATCTGIQCIRHAVFNLEDALLRKHWKLEPILTSINSSRKRLENYKDALNSPFLQDVSKRESVSNKV